MKQLSNENEKSHQTETPLTCMLMNCDILHTKRDASHSVVRVSQKNVSYKDVGNKCPVSGISFHRLKREKIYVKYYMPSISDFRVTFYRCVKASPGAQPIDMEMNLIL